MNNHDILWKISNIKIRGGIKISNEDGLLDIIKECNAGASFPTLGNINLESVDDERKYEQQTIKGVEKHRLKTYLSILLLRTMRDFTDTDTGVYKSHCAVGDIIELCGDNEDLKERMMRQIANFLKSPKWQCDSTIERYWTCIYCGEMVVNDGEGFSRRGHLKKHGDVLPLELDDGFPFSKSHIDVARDHILECLCRLKAVKYVEVGAVLKDA